MDLSRYRCSDTERSPGIRVPRANRHGSDELRFENERIEHA